MDWPKFDGDTKPIQIELLAIVGLPKEQRISCQAKGCGHSVYARVHIISIDGSIQVVGSECFKRLIGEHGIAESAPKYGSSQGQELNEADRALLQENTERLLLQWEVQQEQFLASREQMRKDNEAAMAERRAVLDAVMHRTERPRRKTLREWELGLSQEEAEAFNLAIQTAKNEFRRQLNADPEPIGWLGWMKVIARAMVEAQMLGKQFTPRFRTTHDELDL